MSNLEYIKKILDSDAGLIIEDISQPKKKKVIDNRFTLIKQSVEQVEDKDSNFYTELIKLISNYINQLYDKKVEDFPRNVLDENGEILKQDYDKTETNDMHNLGSTNNKLSEELFKYVCNILENNKDVKLDIETLKKLLNRKPKLFTFSVEKSYLYRTFDYKTFVKIINENKTLEKSNIDIDDIYQLLFDTCQLNNDDVFASLVKPEQFNQNHQKIDEILSQCNAKAFVEITDIIRNNFDNNFDRFTIIKNKNKNKYLERVIIELLNRLIDKDDYDLIHKILTNPDIEIDYDLYYSDYIGQSDLKSLIALSENSMIIKDLLSKEKNVQDYYYYAESRIQLFRLYGIIGDYEKALINFNEKYNYKNDYIQRTNDDFNKLGHTYGSWSYKDTIASFIEDIIISFNEQNIDYSMRKTIINKILNNDKVKYINFEEVLPLIHGVLSNEDFNTLLEILMNKKNTGDIGFITATDILKVDASTKENNNLSVYERFIINLVSDDEIEKYLSSLNKNEKNKILSLNSIKKDD